MKKNIRVLLVGPLPPPHGGISAYVESLLHSKMKTVEFCVFDTALPAQVAPPDREGKMSYASIVESGILIGIKMVSHVVWSYFRFLKTLWSLRPDIVQVFPSSYWSYWRNLIYLLMAKLTGRKIIFHLLNAIDVFYNNVGNLHRALITASLNVADAYILQSPKLGEWVKRYSRRRVFGVWNGIDRSNVPHQGEYSVRGMFRKEPLGVTVGKLGENKGTPLILSALETLKRRGTGVKWIFIGGGDVQSFRSIAEKKGLGEYVSFTGPVDDAVKWEYLYQADFFCLPSFAEGQPISIIEAMAVALPIISTNVGSIPEIVEDKSNGLVIPAGDQEALIQAIRFLCENPDIRRSMGEDSRKLFIERHNIESLFAALRNIYSGLIPT